MKSKVGVVARREFLSTIKRPSYLIATLGMPVFVLAIAAVSVVPALIMARKEARMRTVGIVDRSGLLELREETTFSPPPPLRPQDVLPVDIAPKGSSALVKAFGDATRIVLKPYPDLVAGQQALRDQTVAALVEFPEDYLQAGKVRSYQRQGFNVNPGSQVGSDLLRKFVVERLLAGKLDPALMERVRRPLSITRLTLQKDGTFQEENLAKEIGSFVVPIVFAALFFLSVMMSSGFLLQGVSEEKENRVIEVILSSIDSDSLLTGKLIGLGGAGLLQIVVWVGLVLIPGATLIVHLHLRPFAVAWSLVFYLLGFLLFGVLLTGTGSLGQNLKESQQYGMMWSFGSVVPLMFMMVVISEPNGVFARVLTFIPLTAPATMFLRLHSAEPPPWWEVLLAAAVLAASVWGALKLMSKIFRVGLLLYGKRPTIPEIFKVLRRPAA